MTLLTEVSLILFIILKRLWCPWALGTMFFKLQIMILKTAVYLQNNKHYFSSNCCKIEHKEHKFCILFPQSTVQIHLSTVTLTEMNADLTFTVF